jgi:hypothetical protein
MFQWLNDLLVGATDQQQDDILGALQEATGYSPDASDSVAIDIPEFTTTEADAFLDAIPDWQSYLSPPAADFLEIAVAPDDPQFSNYVLTKDLFDLSPEEADILQQVGFETAEPPTRKLVHSNYFVTINTNMKPPEDRAYEIAAKFRAWLVGFVFTNSVYEQVFVLNNGADTFSKDNVESIKSIITLEIGQVQKRLHAHVLLNVAHRSRLHINFPRFKAILNQNSFDSAIKGFYCNWNLLRDRSGVIDYMAKGTLRALEQKDLLSTEPSLRRIVGV